MLRVQDIMTTDVVTVNPGTTLRDAAELFARRHVGGAPVVDGYRLVGVVSATDILTFAAGTAALPRAGTEPAQGWSTRTGDGWAGDHAAPFFAERWAFSETDPAHVLGAVDGERGAVLTDHTVSEVMKESILCLPPSEDVVAAAERMRSADVHRLLVVDRGELLGILSTTDLARAVADRRLTPRPTTAARRS